MKRTVLLVAVLVAFVVGSAQAQVRHYSRGEVRHESRGGHSGNNWIPFVAGTIAGIAIDEIISDRPCRPTYIVQPERYERTVRYGYATVQTYDGPVIIHRVPVVEQPRIVYVQPEPQRIIVQQQAPQQVVVQQPQVIVQQQAPQQVVVQPAPVAQVFPINVPSKNGGYITVNLTQKGSGFTGPQGEYYETMPSVDFLKAMYDR